MQVQDIDNLASSVLQASDLPAPSATVKKRNCLPIHWLEPYERVDSQFSTFWVNFEAAIAIRPSNPRFQVGDLPVAIMSPHQGKTLKFTVDKTVTTIEVWLVGGAGITVTALDPEGHCVAIAQTQTLPADAKNCTLQAQSVVLNTQGASTVRLDSKLPFILTRLAVERA